MAQRQAMTGADGSTKRRLTPESKIAGGPPDAAATNRDHPAAPSARIEVPGAGIVDRTADAYPKGTRSARRTNRRTAPGKDARDARLQAPGAERPGTTDTGPAARAARGAAGPGIGGETEVSQESGGAPLSIPGQAGAAPSPGSSGMRETSDPNFPLTHAAFAGQSKNRQEPAKHPRKKSAR